MASLFITPASLVQAFPLAAAAHNNVCMEFIRYTDVKLAGVSLFRFDALLPAHVQKHLKGNFPLAPKTRHVN